MLESLTRLHISIAFLKALLLPLKVLGTTEKASHLRTRVEKATEAVVVLVVAPEQPEDTVAAMVEKEETTCTLPKKAGLPMPKDPNTPLTIEEASIDRTLVQAR